MPVLQLCRSRRDSLAAPQSVHGRLAARHSSCFEHFPTHVPAISGSATYLHGAASGTRLGDLAAAGSLSSRSIAASSLLEASTSPTPRSEIQMSESTMRQHLVHTMSNTLARPSHLLRKREDLFAYRHRVLSDGGDQTHLPALPTQLRQIVGLQQAGLQLWLRDVLRLSARDHEQRGIWTFLPTLPAQRGTMFGVRSV